MATNTERDIELNILSFKEDYSLANGEPDIMREPTYEMPHKTGHWRTWINSFRRDPHSRITPKNAFTTNQEWPAMYGGGRGDEAVGETREFMGRNYYDLRAANYRTAHSLLARELKGRHLQMIAIGGSIGERHLFPFAVYGDGDMPHISCPVLSPHRLAPHRH